MWDGLSVDTDWFTKDADAYEISSAAGLAGLAQLVDGGERFEGATVALTVNVDLGGHEWNPIGGDPSAGEGTFCGTFDGGNNKITGFYTVSPEGYHALFASVSGGTLKNFLLQGSVQGRESTAGVASVATDENFENIVCDVDIFSTNFFENVGTGGLVGVYFADEAGATFSIDRCVNNGSIEANSYDVAGLIGSAGLADGTSLVIKDCANNGYVYVDKASEEADACAAGLVARLGSFGTYRLENCVNNADVHATDLRCVAGLVGSVESGGTSFVRCTNTGAVSTGTLNTLVVAAGIVANATAPSYTVKDCANEGELSVYDGSTIDIAAGRVTE